MRREFSAGIVLFTENGEQRKYLLLHYPGGHFDFPKGHLEGDETEKEAATRELEEETGITHLELIDGYCEKIKYQFRHQGGIIQKGVTFFLGKTSKEEVTISHEHQASMWLPYKEAHRKLTFETAKNLLEKAENHLNRQNP
ncbi:NUDIX domain-containing protein [Patescibacteria group bacterium]|nr:NUDIX domain-containing protein [Patescibacteria group bacterium]MBU1703693.1 NUDIX domain-containing protein [Patescibacteria group bacterium]MBU1953513.1 NUDIX domain-containing protein [Patescibacteria group bacterium]